MLVVIQTDSNGGGGQGNSKTGTVVSIICGPTPVPSCTPNTFTAMITGDQEVPPNNSTASGAATVVLNPDPAHSTVTVDVTFSGLAARHRGTHSWPRYARSNRTAHHSVDGFPGEYFGNLLKYVPDYSGADSDAARWACYINIHNEPFPDGEIRGQLIGCPAALLANMSTRMQVETDDNVMIGGIIITGTRPRTCSSAPSARRYQSRPAGRSNFGTA